MALCAALLSALGSVQAGPALAADGNWRIGHHQGFDRIVAPLARGAAFTSHLEGGALVVESAGLAHLTGPAGEASAEQRAVTAAVGRLAIAVPPGCKPVVWQLGEKLVVDLPCAASASKERRAESARPADRPASTAAARRRTARVATPHASSPAPAPAPLVAPAPQPAPAPVPVASPMPAVPGPVRSTALPPPGQAPFPAASVPLPPPLADRPQAGASQMAVLPAEPGFPQGSVIVPAPADAGAAAFRLGELATVVFDKALPLDLGPLKDDPVYGSAATRPLATGALLQFKLAGEGGLRLLRRPDGWQIGAGGAGSAPDPGAAPIQMSVRPDGLMFAAHAPAAALVIDDMRTGARLLVGTQRVAGGHVLAARRSPEFSVPATWQGVVVETASDRLLLRPSKEGFILSTAGGPVLATAWPQSGADAAERGAAVTRRLDVPDLPVSMLRNRLLDARRDAASAPRLGRAAAERRVAEAMLALGLDREALAVLRVVDADNPGTPGTLAADTLRRAATWLAGEQAGGPSGQQALSGARDASLAASDTDEDSFWRAIGPAEAASRGGTEAEQAAATLGATWSVALGYPAPIRDRLLPRVAEILLRTGQKLAAQALLAASPTEQLDLARAMAADADGRTDEALAGYDRVAVGADRDRSAKARRAAVERRLASGRIDGAQAAAALQSQLFAWRGDGRELDLRMRAAALLGASGQWRPALALLRGADKLFPQAHDTLHAAETGLVASLLTGDRAAKVPPLELVALVAECADLLEENPEASSLAPVLVDKLLALDLPGRAEPILSHMAEKAAGDVPRAELGLRLAALRLAAGDAAGAAAALEASRALALPAELTQRRRLFEARMLASIGDTDGALKLLDPMPEPEALEMAAGLFELRRDWKQASGRLALLLPALLPAHGTLDDKQADMVLRYASDAAQAADMPALRQMQDDFASRIAAGARADLFRVLTQTPVSGVGDLPRAGQELASARALPEAMSALRAP